MLKLRELYSAIFLFVILFYLLGYPNEICAQDKASKIDELMTKTVENRQFIGSVLVAENGKVIYKNGFGYANMDWKIPNKPDVKFRIGSITKQFVAMQIMQLVEEGKIKLDGKLIDYLPEYRKDTGEKVTIHHLLDHTSGIPSYTSLPGFWSDSIRNSYEIDYMVKNFHSEDLEFEPGSDVKYNNTGYFLLAVVIEKVTGKSFEENLNERILEPAQMSNSGVDRNEKILDNRANGYVTLGRGTGYVNEPYICMANVLGAADMYSTVEDLYLWDKVLYTEKLLSEKYKEIYFTPYIHKVALGESTDSVDVISKGGGIRAFTTMFFRLIKDKHLIVIFTNSRNGYGRNDPGEMCSAITNILYDKPYKLPKISIAETLGKTILESNVESAIKQYHKLKANQYEEHIFDEYELTNLGYQLLEIKKVKEAIEIFKLNVEEYPYSFYPFMSLGYGYMIDGEKELAIKNYAKSLELNPKNTNVIKLLTKINKSK